MFKQVARCRICRGEDLWEFLDLGDQPPSNALLRAEDLAAPEPRYPLRVATCRTCELAQLTHVVAPEILFQQNYVYHSSVSAAMTRHFAALAAEVARRFVPAGGLVVELGSNDGILLRSLLGQDLRVLGIDPASNLAAKATESGVPTLPAFFTRELAVKVRSEHGPASAMHANNVFAHIDDLHDVMRGVDALLADEGAFVIEAPYLVDLLQHGEFDTIYHEHVSYFGVRPFTHLFEQYGFEVFEVQRQPVHGGTIRVFGGRRGAHPVHASVAELLDLERTLGVARPETLAAFARKVAALRVSLRGLVANLRAQGKRVVGYTAPAKGNVLLNYCGLGPSELDYLADATPAKQGMYSPGVRIPIRSPEHFHEDRPDYALLLAWNHRAEVLAKESAFREAGGKFILPLPQLEIV